MLTNTQLDVTQNAIHKWLKEFNDIDVSKKL